MRGRKVSSAEQEKVASTHLASIGHHSLHFADGVLGQVVVVAKDAPLSGHDSRKGIVGNRDTRRRLEDGDFC